MKLEIINGINLISGPVCAGKSAELIDAIGELEKQGFSCLPFAFTVDESATDVIIWSRARERKISAKVLTENGLDDLFDKLLKYGAKRCKKTALIFDEWQFSVLKVPTKTILKYLEVVTQTLGCTVIVAGLDKDYLGKYFEATLQLSKITDSQILLRGNCYLCKCEDTATESIRMIQSGERFLEGRDDIYAPVCKPCFNKFMRKDQ